MSWWDDMLSVFGGGNSNAVDGDPLMYSVNPDDLDFDAFTSDLPGIDLGALLSLDSFGDLPDMTSVLQGPGMFTDPATGAVREWTPNELEYMQTGSTVFDNGNGNQVFYTPNGVVTYDNINDQNALVHSTSMDGRDQAWYQNGNAAIYNGLNGEGGYDSIKTGVPQANGTLRQDSYTPGGGQQTSTATGTNGQTGNTLKDILNGNGGLNKLGLAALAAYLMNKDGKNSGSSGGWTPPANLSYNREQKAQDPNRRPGAANPGGYFGNVTYAAQGGLLKGPGDGLSDSIPAQIDGAAPAQLGTGEFVIPADVTSALGGGDSEAGARRLEEMLRRVRTEAHGHDQQIRPVSDKALPR